jgi:hypothetical protein
LWLLQEPVSKAPLESSLQAGICVFLVVPIAQEWQPLNPLEHALVQLGEHVPVELRGSPSRLRHALLNIRDN